MLFDQGIGSYYYHGRQSCRLIGKGPVTRVPHGQRMRNELRLTIKKRMTLTKEKYNQHEQRTLPYDKRPFKGSNGHETDNNGCQNMAFVPHT